MSKKKKFRSFSSRLVRWLTLSLLITIGAVSYELYMLVASSFTGIECLNRMNMLDYTNESINSRLSFVELAAKNHDVLIEQSLNNRKELEEKLRDMIQENPHITGVGIGFIENYFPQRGHWYELYATRDSTDATGIKVEQIGSEEHNYFRAEWFIKGLKADKENGYWTDAYFDDSGAKDLLTTYSMPLCDQHGKVVAVLGTDVSLKQLQEHLKNIDEKNYENWWLASNDILNKDETRERYAAYSFILQRDGRYLAHPDSKRLLRANLYDEVEISKDTLDNQIADSIKLGKRAYLVDKDGYALKTDFEGVSSYIFYGPVKRTGWTTVIVTPAIAIDIAGYFIGILVIIIMVIGMIVALIVCHFVVRHATKPLKRLAQLVGEVGDGNFDVQLPDVKNHDEIRLLRDSFENMQESLSHYMDELKQRTAEKASMQSELRIAHNIQMAMLPKVFPPFPERNDIDIFGLLTPAKGVGGDLFDFYLRDEKLFFCIGDVSGKGIPASLVMAVTRSLFRNISKHVNKPDTIVSALNNAIVEGNDSCMFVTLFVGVLDLSNGHMLYCNAGHDAPMLIGQGVGPLLCDANLPVGVIPNFNFSLQETEVSPQTTIFLYTDGLNEAEDINHAQFGNKRILKLATELLAKKQYQPQPLIEQMTEAVHQFVGHAEQSDDLTMLAIQWKNN